MQPSRRSFLHASLLSVSLGLLVTTVQAGPRRRKLFVITRSTNANTVHYDLRLRRDGSPDTNDPVAAYWVMAAEDGRREGLTWLERQLAYGYEVLGAVGSNGFGLRLMACDARTIGVEPDETSRWRARLTIAGRRGVLERLHVQTDESGSRVRHIDLYGFLPETGQRLTERLKP